MQRAIVAAALHTVVGGKLVRALGNSEIFIKGVCGEIGSLAYWEGDEEDVEWRQATAVREAVKLLELGHSGGGVVFPGNAREGVSTLDLVRQKHLIAPINGGAATGYGYQKGLPRLNQIQISNTISSSNLLIRDQSRVVLLRYLGECVVFLYCVVRRDHRACAIHAAARLGYHVHIASRHHHTLQAWQGEIEVIGS